MILSGDGDVLVCPERPDGTDFAKKQLLILKI